MSETSSTASLLRVADVVLDVRTAGSDAIYTYAAAADSQPGDAVIVPLGPRQALGFVCRVYEIRPEDLGYPVEKLKPLGTPIDGLTLPEPLVDLVAFTASESLSSLSVALSAGIPPGALDRLETVWTIVGDEPADLSVLQKEAYATIRDAGGKLVIGAKKKLEAPIQKALRALKSAGVISEALTLAEPTDSKKAAALFRLTPDEDAIDAFLKNHAKKRPAQALTLLRLKEIDDSALSQQDIKALCGVTDQTVKQLAEAGLLVKVDAGGAPPHTPPTPNKHQKVAIEAIIDSIGRRSPDRFLLFGVTGSGKTEVYLRAAAEAIRVGRQVLYLVPEIALATQAVWQLRERFGKSVAILHSELAPGERLANWRSIRSGEAAIVLGARSALFAPLADIGLIVMDEEHEASYKQESAPRYHAKRLAQFLAERHGCPLVLGSATPSIESFFEAEHEKLTLLSLPSRAASAKLPEVHVVDLGEGFRKGKPSLFSDALAHKMEETLERKEQTILFLNRRAYAPFLMCRDCGRQFMCPNCSVSLTYSRKSARLRCHHCGHSERPPDACPECGGSRVSPFGVGTEKVEEAVAELLPTARVARLDRDIAQRKGALEEILASFGAGEIDVLVGTQMVAKGLNFPGVTLVGVIAADLSLNIPDFRASERTYQLLSQVAGRAGRGTKPGQVVIQTFNPDHVAVRAAQEHRFHTLYEELLGEREAAQYPPFKRLVNVLVTGESASGARQVAQSAATALVAHGVAAEAVLGPTECALERLNNLWRFHVLLKLAPDSGLADVDAALKSVVAKGVSVVVDVDPYSMV